MDIQRDIISKLNLSEQQRREILKMGNPAEIGKFLKSHNISVPQDVQKLLGNIPGAASAAGAEAVRLGKQAAPAVKGKAGDIGGMVKGALDSTDLDEKLIGGIKGLGKKN